MELLRPDCLPGHDTGIIEVQHRPGVARQEIVGVRAAGDIDDGMGALHQVFRHHIAPGHLLAELVLGERSKHRLSLVFQQFLRCLRRKVKLNQLPIAFMEIAPVVGVIEKPVLDGGVPFRHLLHPDVQSRLILPFQLVVGEKVVGRRLWLQVGQVEIILPLEQSQGRVFQQ